MIRRCESATATCDGPHNAQLQDEVAKELLHHGLRRVNVMVDGRRVVLSGTVNSYYMKQIAQETARKTCPEMQLYNDVDVIQSVR